MTPPAKPATTEREIKLEIPADAWDGLVQAMRAAPCRRTPLHAIYHDTPDRALARAGIALRVRREGSQWVQTLKAKGAGLFDRVEDNLPLALRGKTPPVPDLARHQRPGVRGALRAGLGLAPRQRLPALEAVFSVNVQRLTRVVVEGASRIEIALDEGVVEAAGRSSPIREVEFELVEGNVGDLLRLARKWRERHGLWTSLDSKAARGHRLSMGPQPAGPSAGMAPRYAPDAGMGEVSAAILRAALAQVIANADAIAKGGTGPEHVHQLRVGLRRLRTALRELPLLRHEQAKFDAPLAATFRALGAWRDRTHVMERVRLVLAEESGDDLQLPDSHLEIPRPAEAVVDAAFQDALLALLARAEELPGEPGRHVRRTLRPALERLLRQVLLEGKRFRSLDLPLQHRVRKRLKRLRYLAEGVAPLFPKRRLGAFLEALKPVQDALGDYTDTMAVIALVADSQLCDATLGAALVARLVSQRDRQARACQKLLRQLAGVDVFWKK